MAPSSIGSRRHVLLVCALATIGCGGTTAPPAAYVADNVGAHGGLLVPLPKDRGFGEVLSKPLPKATAKADGVLAVYFLSPEKSAALTPPPSAAALKIKMPGQEAPLDVPLKLQADAKDPVGGSLFTSAPGLFSLDQLFGDLIVTVDGESVTIPFEKHR
ncbi:hypothetical protein [Paludisphaera mucosa]|uniref:Uncharacterized protein n=1 Tax=Paludisphaera mucosa TaxID=3030827 RepID=A0ABT6FFE3_9BACT|nr:hypothetical protein [Paludisphaera mucosa]MDG3006118.1 hypothetical protein [Paludisphaera mucosa]